MKKRITRLIIILVFLFLIACNSDNDTTTVKDGTYVLEQAAGAESHVAPSVTIENDNISFSYDLLSSYLAVGQYTVEKDLLTMKTNDENYTYVFQIDDDQLIFKENESSEIKIIDEKFGVKITNNLIFKLIDE